MPPTQASGPERLVSHLRDAVRLGEVHAITRRLQDVLAEAVRSGQVALPIQCTRPSPDHYTRRLLHRDPELDFTAVVMTWGPGQGTPLHDHAGIWCVEAVVQGEMAVRQFELTEEQPDGLCRFVERSAVTAAVGSSGALIPPFEYHTLANAHTDRVSITLHVYGGEMDHCSVYEPRADGLHARQTRMLTYTE